MKKILITGINSYVGKSLEKWLQNNPKLYSIDLLSMKNESWKDINFSKYDVIFHVAGIAHVSTDPQMEEKYYKVNRDLTIEVAQKAKAEGVKQFIFMSSIIVYGESRSDKRVIDESTIPSPSNFYGKSKLQAENSIRPLENENFKIVIIRPPMIYGKGSKGNYPKLAKVARKIPFFPDMDNVRSMLHIDNLCEFIKLMIDNGESGLFYPQNKEYVKTSEMVKLISESHGKKLILTTIFNPLIKILCRRFILVNKVFGNLIYKKSLSSYKENYQLRSLRESIKVTERN